MSSLTHTMWGEQGFPLVTFKGTSDLRSLRSSFRVFVSAPLTFSGEGKGTQAWPYIYVGDG